MLVVLRLSLARQLGDFKEWQNLVTYATIDYIRGGKMEGIYLIAAVGQDGGLGADNQLLWHLKPDLEHFRQLTTGHLVVMGGKTYRSLGKPLKNRPNLVLTRSRIEEPGVETFHDLTELKQAVASLEKPVYIIGGASLYAEFLPLAEKLYLTEIAATKPADVYFPQFDPNDFHRRELQSGESEGIKFTICEYVRK